MTGSLKMTWGVVRVAGAAHFNPGPGPSEDSGADRFHVEGAVWIFFVLFADVPRGVAERE